MDEIAVISDIHGNLPALQAVLDDIRRRGIERIFCLGDLVGKGPDGAAAVDLCRERCERTVRGNWDESIVREADNPMVRWHQAQLGPERLAYLAALPNTIELQLSGRRIRLFHASQVGVYHRVFMDHGPERHRAMFTNTAFTGDAPVPTVVGYGDIHQLYLLCFDGKILFNAGSVGNPLDGTTAAYAILQGTADGERAAPFEVRLIRVPYDIERAVADAERARMPDLAPYVDELRTAHYRGLPRPAP